MKRIISTAVVLCLAIVATAQVSVFNPDDFKPGKPIDKMKYRIHYDMTFVEDTTALDSAGHYRMSKREPMLLDIGKKTTLFYSYTKWRTDSAVCEALKRGENSFHTESATEWKLYKHYPKPDEYSYLDGISSERYVCTEKIEEPKWALVPDSTKEILGYSCQLATASYRGRHWSAWYADAIPLSEGPWKLGGLPGLILRAYDAAHQYEFECTAMKPMTEDIDIEYKGDKYEAIDKKTLEKLYRRYYADPVGYVTGSNPNIKVVVRDEHGNDIKMPAKPYNPIER